jgi:Aspartyl/Asparaginyl beta-hydroxylase
MKITRVQKPKTVRPLGPVEVTRLIDRVRQITDQTWSAEDSRKENTFEVFHHTRHINFRFIRGNNNPLEFYSAESWPMWRPLLEPVMEAAVRPYGFERPIFPKVMLARLAAGGVIDPHADGPGSNLVTHKIHVPLVTNDGALFLTGEVWTHLEAGQAYEVNNIDRHGVVNNGDEDRIHFIFEVFEAAGLDAAA